MVSLFNFKFHRRRTSALLLCLLLSSHADARVITDVVIQASGQSAEADPRLVQECRRFKPTAAQISRFFGRAYPVPRRFGLHERYSPCFASGTILFADVGRARWSLSSSGVGTIAWDEGESDDVFYKKNGWTDPAACTYGLGDRGEC